MKLKNRCLLKRKGELIEREGVREIVGHLLFIETKVKALPFFIGVNLF